MIIKIDKQTGLKILMVNKDLPTQCPFKQLMPTQGLQGMGLSIPHCNSACPHFSVIDVELDEVKTKVVHLTCGNSEASIEVENPEYLK